MIKRIILIILCVFFSSGLARAEISSLESFQKTDRVLILAPHPDDETIACGGIIQQALSVGAKVHVVYLTNGDHNEFAFIVYKKELILTKAEFIEMGELRRKEAIQAMKFLGLRDSDLVFLGYPDYGTFAMFKDYWQTRKPFKDFLTRISNVPYKKSLSYGASYKPESILSDLEKAISLFRPNKIFVSHPADVNVDHKSLYLFLEVALADLSWEMPRPKIYPYLIHVVGWPLPRHYRPELSLSPPNYFSDFPLKWSQYLLTPEQLENKYDAVLYYRSQTASSAFYLLAFARKNELFSEFPLIKLDMPEQAVSVQEDKIAVIKKRILTFFDLTNRKLDEKDAISAEDLDTGARNMISYALEDNALLVRIRKAKESSERRVTATIYLFGYSYDTDFAKMPKISIITKYKNFRVFDARKLINPEGVGLDLFRESLIVKVPLKVLGNPDFVLVQTSAYTGALPGDTLGFCKINLVRRK